jgi:hypothetical protein
MANRSRENSAHPESEALREGRSERLRPSQSACRQPGQLSSRERSRRLLNRLLPLVCHLKKESNCFSRSSAVSDKPTTPRNWYKLTKKPDRQGTMMVVSASLGWMTFERMWIST